jgi:hypothetical protein
VAAGFVYADFAHAVEGGSLGQGDGVAFEALQDVGEVFHFDEEADVERAGARHELGSVFADAFDGLQHQFRAVLHENDETEAVSFRHVDGFGEAHAVDPERQGFFDFVHHENGCDLHGSMLRGAAGSGIGKNGHRSLAGELMEIADEVGLVEVFGFERDVGPVRATGAVGDAAGVAEAQHAREALGGEPGFFETAAAELARAEICLMGDEVEIGIAVRGGKGFDGLLRGIGRVGGRGKIFKQDSGGALNGVRVIQLALQFAGAGAPEIFERK